MIANWVRQLTTTTGTGAITLGTTPAGYVPFSARFANGALVQYAIIDGNNREVGIGTYSSGVLTRTTKLEKLDGGTWSANPGTGISLSGAAIVTCTNDANFTPYLHPTYQELRPGNVRILTPTGTNDHTRINAATDGFVGRVILAPGNWAIAGTVYMRPYCYIEGCGINATILTPVGTVTMFGFDSSAQGYGADKQSWGLKDCTLYGYSNASKAIDTKMSTYSMQDCVIERVYFDGFGNGPGSSSTAVVDILDPWGLRFENCIIEQTGDRPAMKVTANGSSVNGAMISRLKIKNNAGDNLLISGCDSLLISDCEFYSSKVDAKNLQFSGGKLNIVRGCAFEYGAADGIRLTGSSQGNTFHACTLIGNGATSKYGIYADTGSSANSFVGCLAINYSVANLTDNNAGGSNRWVAVYNGTSFVEAELARGELVMPCPGPVLGGRAFHLVIPERTSGTAALERFRAWLEAQADTAAGGSGMHARPDDSRYARTRDASTPSSRTRAASGPVARTPEASKPASDVSPSGAKTASRARASRDRRR